MASSSATDYWHQRMMDFVLKGAALVPVGNLWIGLYTTVPSLAGSGGVEVSTASTGYGRVAIVSGAGTQWLGCAHHRGGHSQPKLARAAAGSG